MDQYIGKMLDNRYEILDVIGVGGMAVVYKAYCHRLHRFVAIKVLKRDLASDAEFRRRFHEEAQAVAMLSHPNIVSVYDVSRGDDLDYIVMELIDGITLKQYMQKKDGSLNWRESLYFITQIVRALGHAHGRGIIHRDIKPQNIMVLRDGSVKVADFGIARIMSAAQNTLTQEALGSVHYISPEQARGSHIDARADIYSAGVVLYEMLTGRLPFDGDSPVSVAIQHINSTPLSPQELNPDIPRGLEEITMKAMASRIDQRYMNAEAMLRDLEEFRKNPQVEFHYNLASFHGSQPMPDEPTQVLEPAMAMGRRPRPQARPRPAPPPPPPRRRPPEEPKEYRPDSRKNKGNRAILIAAIACLVAAGVLLGLYFFGKPAEKEPELVVPDLIGRTLTEVYGDTEITNQFKVIQTAVEYSDEFKEGQIISQDPKKGTKLKDQKEEEGVPTINVVVSGGHKYIEMINVRNMTYDAAVAQIRAMNLQVDTPEQIPSNEVKAGNVVSQTPPEGTHMSSGDVVHLVVSSGPEIRKVMVPDVRGQSIEQAQEILAAVKIKISSIIQQDDTAPVGQVVYQSIPPNTPVEEGTSIALNVSRGLAPQVQKPQEAPEEQAPEKSIEISGADLLKFAGDKEKVPVLIQVDGETLYKDSVNVAGPLSIPLKGHGTQNIQIWINEQEVEKSQIDQWIHE